MNYIHALANLIHALTLISIPTICTISRCPWAAAKCKGVSSPLFVAFTRAPLLSNISTILTFPFLDAQCKGLNPWSSLKQEVFFEKNLCDKQCIFIFIAIYSISHPWFISCSVSSSHTLTWRAFPSLHQWNISSIGKKYFTKTISVNKKWAWITSCDFLWMITVTMINKYFTHFKFYIRLIKITRAPDVFVN